MKFFVVLFIAFFYCPKGWTTPAKIEDTCQINPKQCLKLVEERLHTGVEPKTSEWYRFKFLQIQALFDLEQAQALSKVLNELNSISALPTFLQLKVYILSAKNAMFRNNVQDFDLYKSKTFTLMKALNLDTLDPYSLIEYANFHIYLKDYQTGIELLLPLEEKFRDHPNSELKKTIYTNLGNMHALQKLYKDAFSYFKLAFENAQLSLNKHYALMTHYNVARSHQMLEMHHEAEQIFLDVLAAEKTIGHPTIKNLCHYRLAMYYSEQNYHSKLKIHLEQVDPTKLSTKLLNKYQLLLSNE
ncbi:tetratricopeptide repeat protein [Pseudoalteromonas sp. SSM20]|uniref:tetratricopeptide repeat protein n=1 Tax=Pseudoalteromonas sp. SSM20 TaxID=3139394 RepID=UPI003BA8A346